MYFFYLNAASSSSAIKSEETTNACSQETYATNFPPCITFIEKQGMLHIPLAGFHKEDNFLTISVDLIHNKESSLLHQQLPILV